MKQTEITMQVETKMRLAYVLLGLAIFFPEQFVTSEMTLQQVLQAFKDLSEQEKLEITMWSPMPETVCVSGRISAAWHDAIRREFASRKDVDLTPRRGRKNT